MATLTWTDSEGQHSLDVSDIKIVIEASSGILYSADLVVFCLSAELRCPKGTRRSLVQFGGGDPIRPLPPDVIDFLIDRR